MIRLRIEVPSTAPRALFETHDQIHNVLIYAMKAHGYHPPKGRPAAWGFGIESRPVSPASSRKHPPSLWRVHAIYVGSADPDASQALAQITPEDLLEPSQVPQSGLDLRSAVITQDGPWIDTDVLALRPITPIRVLEHRDGANGSTALLTLGPAWEAALNRTMTARLGRPVTLTVIPDDLYVREHNGHIVGSRVVKKVGGRPIALPGLDFPFILVGPPSDLRDAWLSGLGAGTGMGFGCVAI